MLSDSPWFHISGERVIKFDGNYVDLRDYILQSNSKFQLKNIEIIPFSTENVEAVNIWVDPLEYKNYFLLEYYRQFK